MPPSIRKLYDEILSGLGDRETIATRFHALLIRANLEKIEHAHAVTRDKAAGAEPVVIGLTAIEGAINMPGRI